MRGAVLVAVAATIGNLLQGWDNATIAGSVTYIKKEFDLQSQPTVEGLILATSLIGATIITTFCGPASDFLGRRSMLIISSILYFTSGLVTLWAPNVYVLLLARLLDGFGIGLALTLVPVYISETAPSEIRGRLNTLPLFSGTSGMFLSYCMVFGMSLTASPRWRLMLGVLSIPSLLYLALTVFYLPESPRWLVSKGRMAEAKCVLQRLRGREDVTGEMALLVEGLGVGGDTRVAEYVIGDVEHNTGIGDKSQIRLYGPQEGVSMLAKLIPGQSALGIMSSHGSMLTQSVTLMDPLVTMFDSVHEKTPAERGGGLSFPKFGSVFSTADHRNEQWDEDMLNHDDDYASDGGGGEEDNLRSPLLSRQASSLEKDGEAATASMLGMDIGGGWQLAYRRSESGGENLEEGCFKRVYLHQKVAGLPASQGGSILSASGVGGDIAAALESISAISPIGLESHPEHPVGPEEIRASKNVVNRPSWQDLFEPGVKRALVVGIGIQILQQFAGINGVLYYTPQILEEAGVGILLSNLGISSVSSSLLISAVTSLLMLPCVAIAMGLMDVLGRRWLLLFTIPALIVSLLVLVLGSVVSMGSTIHAMVSTLSLVMYFCFFMMGFSPVPNVLTAEIFPTRVRGICIALCASVFWIADIIVTYTLPLMLRSVGLVGVFGIYAVVCMISWVFVFLKVPETKGMPLEVISEFFALGAQQQQQ